MIGEILGWTSAAMGWFFASVYGKNSVFRVIAGINAGISLLIIVVMFIKEVLA